MAGVRMELGGAEEALGALGAAADRLESPRPLYDEIGAALVVSTQHRFETEQDPEGNPWAQSLRAQLVGGRTLTDTARLVGSLTHEASDEGLAVGTNVIYAAVHQLGAVIKAKTPDGLRFRGAGGDWVRKDQVTIPQRAFLGLDSDDEAEIAAIAGAYVAQPLGGAEGAP